MVIGIGETILDIIFKDDKPMAAVPGGSTFNAIISLGRTGVPCTIVTETGDDHVGDIIRNYLSENGVDTCYVNRNPGTKSHVSLAFLDDNNDAQYQFYKNHAGVSITDNMPKITESDIVIFGSFFAINPVIRCQVRNFLVAAREAGAILYYDINFRASHIQDIPDTIDNLTENMRLSTIVRGSLEDFGYLYGMHNVDEIYNCYIKPCCPCFICTDGAKPIQLRTPLVRASFETPPVKTVSTIGAGDNFNAGFIYEVSRGKHLRHSEFSLLDAEQWRLLIASGQMFSSEVCASLNNSVSVEFAEAL